MLLRSFFEVFNPSVEVGPGRLVSRHPYADGIMPDYPAGPGGGGVGRHRTGRLAAGVDYEDEPTIPDGRQRWARDGSTGAAKSAAEDRSRADAPDSDGSGNSIGSLTDFIVSLIKTVQLTSRATLKRSKSGAAEATTIASTTLRRPR